MLHRFSITTFLTPMFGVALVCSSPAEDVDEAAADEKAVDEIMEEKTQAVYQHGKTNGKPDSATGWPKEFAEIKLRFIRLDHGGKGWDDGMGESGADVNFLKKFKEATGSKAATKGESITVAQLKEYPADGFPPFVFLTGNDNIRRISFADLKILREYCLKGGMLIADASSAKFHRSFMHLMRQVFPDKQLADIADDDMIYQVPYNFYHGAPAFWHHGGRRPLGIKHEDRWCVFYHPGDMNDAWKSEGFSDVAPEMREAAINLGINLVCYSFAHWSEAVQKERK